VAKFGKEAVLGGVQGAVQGAVMAKFGKVAVLGTVSKFGSDAAWVAVHGWRVLRTLLCRLQGATQSAVEGAVAKLGNVAVMVKVLCRVLCRELSTVLSGVSRVQWRSLARVLCKAIRLPCCVSKNCGFPKVRTHAPATLEPWVPMEPNVPMLSNCRFPSIENLRFPT